jgi:HEAT repeats
LTRSFTRSKNGRAIPYLIRVLRNRQETASIRGQAAEGLSLFGKRKAIQTLVECSSDDSAEVRFWCVFALGSFVRRRKTPAIVVRALEERLQDSECPDNRGSWWPVRLEALAMLGANRESRFPFNDVFKETILELIRDPLSHRNEWRWADCYWDDAIADSVAEGRSLYNSALQKIREAGFEPAQFGNGNLTSVPFL